MWAANQQRERTCVTIASSKVSLCIVFVPQPGPGGAGRGWWWWWWCLAEPRPPPPLSHTLCPASHPPPPPPQPILPPHPPSPPHWPALDILTAAAAAASATTTDRGAAHYLHLSTSSSIPYNFDLQPPDPVSAPVPSPAYLSSLFERPAPILSRPHALPRARTIRHRKRCEE